MAVPMIDLRAQYQRIKPEIDAAVAGIFECQAFVGGPILESFEESIAEYVGAPHAIAVASGTDALLLTLKALDAKPGDEIITTSFSFFATAGAVANAGLTPVFVDIDPATYNIDPGLVETAVTHKTRAILPVHLYGQCADMAPILQIARNHRLPVIEDSAQSLGARYKGRPACSIGDAAAVSFYPTKNLGGAGDGGMVVTPNDDIAAHVRLLRAHGADTTYFHRVVGTNSRLDTIQAAILSVKLRHLDSWNAERRERAAYYSEKLAAIPGIVTPKTLPGNVHVFHQYVIRIPNRDKARLFLQKRAISTAVFYPVPLHRQECFRYLGYSENACPNAAQASKQVLALPIFPEISQQQQDDVIAALADFIAQI
ncbi:MAG: DegT/DnrJ/EryC1/StrS family aminotransferase [Candidatus Hydrogenedentes bacterium]|nr:DegT/DnrJ/EryC1/StrS family aminotransferase [Candidatus Hydrogenedentota bacterium]